MWSSLVQIPGDFVQFAFIPPEWQILWTTCFHLPVGAIESHYINLPLSVHDHYQTEADPDPKIDLSIPSPTSPATSEPYPACDPTSASTRTSNPDPKTTSGPGPKSNPDSNPSPDGCPDPSPDPKPSQADEP